MSQCGRDPAYDVQFENKSLQNDFGRSGRNLPGQIRIFDSRIPTTVKVGESVYYSESLIEYAPGNGACEAYRMLAKEVVFA